MRATWKTNGNKLPRPRRHKRQCFPSQPRDLSTSGKPFTNATETRRTKPTGRLTHLPFSRGLKVDTEEYFKFCDDALELTPKINGMRFDPSEKVPHAERSLRDEWPELRPVQRPMATENACRRPRQQLAGKGAVVEAGRLIMPSLRSSIRRRLEAEEAEQDKSTEAESNPVEQADNPDNPVEQAAAEAVQKKLDEQPSPVVEPRMPVTKKKTTRILPTACNELELRAADAAAQIAGHKFGHAVNTPMPSQTSSDRRGRLTTQRARFSCVMAPVSRSSPSWSSGRTTPTKTELTGEESGFLS